ncbi:MAG: hypothetical protein IIX83_04150 [Peptococcaceae bacterium]|nr:hypothetical protein [Peptococcaceae bacterium]
MLKKQAILDIIMTPEDDAWFRLVSYEYHKQKQCDIFKITGDDGDHLYILFSKDGVLIKGCDHESCFSPYLLDEGTEDADEVSQSERLAFIDSMYHGIPDALLALMDDDMNREAVTFCLWQTADETTWHRSQVAQPDTCLQMDSNHIDDGGEKRLMAYIFPSADEWYEWAAIYYELREEGWDAAARIYDAEELTRTMVEDLNPERDYDSIMDECEVNGLL